MMSFLYSSSDESSSESSQSSPNTSGNIHSNDLSKKDNLKEIETTLNLSRAFWNLPADDPAEAKEQDPMMNNDETLLSCYDQDIDAMPQSEGTSGIFHRNSVHSGSSPNSDGQTEPRIFKKVTIGAKLRESLLLILQILVPFSAVAWGAQYIGHCPANWLLPHLILWIGILSAAFVVYLLVNHYRWSTLFVSSPPDSKCEIFFCFVLIFWLVEIVSFFITSASYDTSSKNYCCRPFYLYAVIFNVFTIVMISLGGIRILLHLSILFYDSELQF